MPPGGCPTRSPPPSAGCARPTGCAPAGALSSWLRRLRLDEPAADRVAHELHAVAHAELAQQVAAVGLDGLLAEVEDLADLLVRVRLGDQLEDLLLARRERLLGAGGLVGHPLAHERALSGAGQERLPPGPGAPRVDEVVVGLRLEDVPAGAGA